MNIYNTAWHGSILHRTLNFKHRTSLEPIKVHVKGQNVTKLIGIIKQNKTLAVS